MFLAVYFIGCYPALADNISEKDITANTINQETKGNTDLTILNTSLDTTKTLLNVNKEESVNESSLATQTTENKASETNEAKKEMTPEDERANFISKYEININEETEKPYLFDIGAVSLTFTTDDGLRAKITVNDKIVDDSTIGKIKVHNQTLVKTFTYYSIPLKEGKNIIVATSLDPTNKEYGKKYERIIYVKGKPNKVIIDKVETPADSKNSKELTIQVLDESGNPVIDGTLVSVKISKGTIKSKDEDPNKNGLQVKTINGKAIVEVIPPDEVGVGEIEAEANLILGKENIIYKTPLREPIMLLLTKGNTGYSFVDGKTFEDDPKGQKGFNYNVGASMFTQGTIFNDYLLTFAFDTERKLNALEDESNILFRDRAEDRLYPIYGDSSKLNQLALSNSNVYFKLERDNSSLLWGDFNTDLNKVDALTPRLSNYNRVLTGAKLNLDIPNVTNLNIWGAMSNRSFFRDEISGAGVSGPYFTSKYPMINGTERITIETRDRLIENKIIATKNLNRLTDYNINYENGSIIFSQPVSSFDENLNPNFIVVTYEYYPNSIENAIVGLKFEQPLMFGASIGGSYVREFSQDDPYQLIGLNLKEQVGDYFTIMGEYANSYSNNKYASSYRAAFVSAPIEKLNLKGEYQYVSPEFVNRTGASFVSGSERYLLSADYKPFDSTSLITEFNRSYNFMTKSLSQTLNGKVSQDIFSHKVDLTVEGRSFTDPKSNKDNFATLLGIGYKSPEFFGFSVNAGREQNISKDYDPTKPTTTSVGVDYILNDNVKLYAKQNFLEREKLMTTTAVGVDTGYRREDAKFLSGFDIGAKYQINGLIDGKSSQTSIGLNNKINVLPELALGVAYERVSGIDPFMNIGDDHNAWSLSAEYNPDYIGLKSSIKYDFRDGKNASNLFAVNAAGAVGDDFGLFARYTFNKSSQMERRSSSEGLLGMAYRPLESDFFNAIFKYQIKKRNEGINELSDILNNIISFEGFFQPSYSWEVYTKLALKNSYDSTDGYKPVFSNIGLGLARVTYKINYNFDVVGEYRNLTHFETKTSYNDFTGEIGYFPIKDLRLALGYNLFGYNDKDLITTNYTSQGPYVNVTIKMNGFGNIWGQEEILTKKDLLQVKED